MMQSKTNYLLITQITLVALVSLGIPACFDSNTEEAPPALKTTEPEPSNVSAEADTLNIPPDTSGTVDVLDNDIGDQLSIVGFDDVSSNNGTVVLNSDNTLTYTPSMGFTGEDTFSYSIQDFNNRTSVATVTVTVSDQVIPAGLAFYANNCAICHAAGSGDPTSAFNATDLVSSANISRLNRDLRVYNGPWELMGAFNDVPQKNIDELKAYLGSL